MKLRIYSLIGIGITIFVLTILGFSVAQQKTDTPSIQSDTTDLSQLQKNNLYVSYDKGLISINAQSISLKELFKDISKKTGVEIVLDEEIENQKITIEFKNLSLKQGIEKIIDLSGLKDLAVSYIKGEEGFEISKVEIKKRDKEDVGRENNNHTYISKELIISKWGDGIQEFGLRKGMEIETVGPHTFTLDRKGNVYIFDIIKGYIKKFDKEGSHQTNIGFDIHGSSIAVDKNENIFVLDDHTVNEYSLLGELIGTFSISKNIPLVEGAGQEIKIDSLGTIYVNKFQTVYKIALTNTNTATKISHENQLASKKEGIPSSSKENKLFKIKRQNNQQVKVQILTDNGDIINEINVSTSDSFGATLFLNQDKNGYVYIVDERITNDNYVHLEVRKYDEEGTLVTIIELPNDYYTTVYKKVDVDDSGNIFQLLTLSDSVKLIKWEEKQ